MDEEELKNIIEALLMAAEKPLTLEQLGAVFEDWQKPDRKQLIQIITVLQQEYTNRAIELRCLAGGYCLQTKAKYSHWVGKLQAEKPAKYSQALLETLTIIAYQQPVSRADIEEIRGVSVSSAIIKTLLERGWIKTAGHRDVPGKPLVYVTTKTFLDYFNLASLNELPSLPAKSKLIPDNAENLEGIAS